MVKEGEKEEKAKKREKEEAKNVVNVQNAKLFINLAVIFVLNAIISSQLLLILLLFAW